MFREIFTELKKRFKRFKKNLKSKKKKRRLALIVSFLLVFFFLYYFLIAPLFSLMTAAKALPQRVKIIKSALTMKDLDFLFFELELFRDYLKEIDQNAARLKVFSPLPFVGDYLLDLNTFSSSGLELVETALDFSSSLERTVPQLDYSKWLDLENLGTGKGGDLLEVTLVLASKLPDYREKAVLVNERISRINPDKYPRQLKGITIREYLIQMKQLSAFLVNSYDDLVALVSLLPDLIGKEQDRNYLLLLQNNNELRPSGGIFTAFAVFTVSQGKLAVITRSGDVVFLDQNLANYLSPPDFLQRYRGTRRFYLKDAGYSSDFKVSAQAIITLWSRIPEVPGLDGIVVLDNHFISSLMETLGEVNLPDYGSFNKDNVAEKLQQFATLSGSRDPDDKKYKNAVSAFLYELIRQSFHANSNQKITLAGKVYQETQGKHLLVYFIDERLQKIAEKYNLAGRVRDYQGDYLYFNQANISGDQSNRYLEEKVTKSVEIKNQTLTSTLRIDYENKGEFNQIYNRGYQSYIRIYVPLGSRLINSSGSLLGVNQGQDLGKTFFAGYLAVPPQAKTNFTIKYELPQEILADSQYRLLIQKQPGESDVKYEIQLGDQKEEFTLLADREIEFNAP